MHLSGPGFSEKVAASIDQFSMGTISDSSGIQLEHMYLHKQEAYNLELKINIDYVCVLNFLCFDQNLVCDFLFISAHSVNGPPLKLILQLVSSKRSSSKRGVFAVCTTTKLIPPDLVLIRTIYCIHTFIRCTG